MLCNCIHGSCYNKHCISVSDICYSIKQLKHGKSDGNTGCDSSHIINGPRKLSVYLCLLFNLIMKFNYIPGDMLLSTIISIPKNNQCLSSSDNYRVIALSSIIKKMLDAIILKQNAHIFATDELQFRFKPNHSTTQGTFALNEIVQHYINNKSTVYVLMLDCSEAFNRVNYIKLFSILIDKGLCPSVIRVLINLYTNQCKRIKWGSYFSDTFNVFNGVNKGGGGYHFILFITYFMPLLHQRTKPVEAPCRPTESQTPQASWD